MPSVVDTGSRQLADTSSEVDAHEDARVAGLAASVRAGLREHLQVNYYDTKLLSTEDARAQERYVEEKIASGNVHDLEQLYDDYASEDARARSRKNEELYHKQFREPLEDMRRRNVISDESYREWLSWMEAGQRAGSEKKSSIKQTFPEYRKEREALAKQREEFLKNKQLDKITDPHMKKQIEFLRNDREWFQTLS